MYQQHQNVPNDQKMPTSNYKGFEHINSSSDSYDFSKPHSESGEKI